MGEPGDLVLLQNSEVFIVFILLTGGVTFESLLVDVPLDREQWSLKKCVPKY